MKYLFLILLSILQIAAVAQQTNLPVNGWNCYIHLPGSYDGIKKYPTIIFFPGLGEVGSNAAAVIANGPGAYIAQGWNGNVSYAASVSEFIVISLQPPSAYPAETEMKQRIDALIATYKIDTANIFLTGLSHGGWCATSFVSDPNNNFASKIRAVVGVQSVLPAWDNAPWPGSYNSFAVNRRTLLFEQVQDYRTADVLVNYINSVAPGNGVFIQTNFGGGGHCCWEYFYGGNGRAPELFNIDGAQMTIYEWMASINTNRTQPPSFSGFPQIIIKSKGKRKFTVTAN